MRLFERGKAGVLYNDLNACNNYTSGLEAARNIQCPTMLILGEHDMLTPTRAARELAKEIEDSQTGCPAAHWTYDNVGTTRRITGLTDPDCLTILPTL